MKNMRKWMLGAAVVIGGLGLGSTAAQAAEFGIYVGGPAAYVPPCPGPGYAWVAGYYSGGYWVPGRWNFVGEGYGYYGHERFERWDRDRDWHHGGDWDRDRGWGRDRHWDHDRGEHRGWEHDRR